jgi:pilus assembly protein CpaE
MLSLVVLTPNTAAAAAIERLVEGTGALKPVFKGPPEPMHSTMRAVRVHDPELVLLDVGDWQRVAPLAEQIRTGNIRAVIVGFAPNSTRSQQLDFEEAGIRDLLPYPFSCLELETVAYEALHREHPISNSNILAFLPAKAGGGCSTVTLNTAAALARSFDKKVLLVEADRRSGVLSILLDLQNRQGLSDALQRAGELTPLEWQQYCEQVFGIDVLPANPARRGPLPSWAHYYQLLRFLQEKYDFLFVDLPELVNEATAEVVKSARGIFIICTPEVPSLKMASQRSAELQECEIPRSKIHIVLNRWERGGFKMQDVEKTLEYPVFATLPNGYRDVRDAILESRLVSLDSAFAKGCQVFAQKLSGLPQASPERFIFSRLKGLWRGS